MAKEKSKKQVQTETPMSGNAGEVKPSTSVTYHRTVGINFRGNVFRVELHSVGSDGSSTLLESTQDISRGEAFETFKVWCVQKVLDHIINVT